MKNVSVDESNGIIQYQSKDYKGNTVFVVCFELNVEEFATAGEAAQCVVDCLQWNIDNEYNQQ